MYREKKIGAYIIEKQEFRDIKKERSKFITNSMPFMKWDKKRTEQAKKSSKERIGKRLKSGDNEIYI